MGECKETICLNVSYSGRPMQCSKSGLENYRHIVLVYCRKRSAECLVASLCGTAQFFFDGHRVHISGEVTQRWLLWPKELHEVVLPYGGIDLVGSLHQQCNLPETAPLIEVHHGLFYDNTKALEP